MCDDGWYADAYSSAAQARRLTANREMRDPAAQTGAVAKPRFSGDCWAQKRNYTGSLFASYVGCSKRARKGCLTCYWHRDREAAAQKLKCEG